MLLNSLPVDWTLNSAGPRFEPWCAPPSLRKPRVSSTTPNRAFLRDFRPLIFQILVSVGVHASRRRFWVPCLRIQKFRSRRPALAARRLTYSGLSPSASNCLLHSVGGSRRRSNCSGRKSLRDALCGSRIWRDLLEGGLCQRIVSDGSSGGSDAWSAPSDLSRTISVSLCTTIPATSCARAPRSPKGRVAVADLPWLAARCSFNDFIMTSSTSAAGTRETEPADAVPASPCRTGVDT